MYIYLFIYIFLYILFTVHLSLMLCLKRLSAFILNHMIKTNKKKEKKTAYSIQD